MWTYLKELLGFRKRIAPPPPPPPPPPPERPALGSSLELLSAPQHGKTSFLWSLSFMARKLSLFWPEYVCWPQDDASKKSFETMLQAMSHRELPVVGSASSRLLLALRGMERWGERRLFVEDDRDPVLGIDKDMPSSQRDINWGVPVFWLLSLPDIAMEDPQLIDHRLDEIIRARMRSNRSFEAQPLRLVIVLTKADRIPNLPRGLREYLKGDPLAAVVKAEAALSDMNPERRTEYPVLHFDSKAVQLYLETLWGVHEQITDWLRTTLTGNLLTRYADVHHITLRFCLVSATGSDLRRNGHLAIPWRPRRVLDPLFWALELGCR